MRATILSAAAVVFLATACSKSGEPGPQGPAGQAGPKGDPGAAGAAGPEGLSTVVLTSAEPAGDNCAGGGTRLTAGRDENRNGTLEDTEVDASQTRYVCNGAPGTAGAAGTNGTNGADGFSVALLTTLEPAGANCASGGVRIQAGRDADRDGVLDGDEVDAALTRYLCNGAAGTNGTNGFNVALALSNEAVGSVNCDTGGIRVEAGLDADRDGTLDGTEVNPSLTRYVCNGPKGENGSVFYVRTVVVNPGASAAESGTLLRNAVEGITDGQRWQVKVEPGIYDLGTTGLLLKQNISLEGSGVGATLLRSASATPTVMGAAGAALRFATVENNGGGTDSVGINNNGAADFDVDDVVTTARGGSSGNFGIFMSGVQGTFERVRAVGINSTTSGSARGFHCFNCTVNLLESYTEGQGGSESFGVFTQDGSVSLRNVIARASGASSNWGVYVLTGSVTLSGVEAVGTGTASSNVGTGLFVDRANVSVRNSVLSGLGAPNTYGLFTSNPTTSLFTVDLHHSILNGAKNTVNRASGFNIRIAASQLAGGPIQHDAALPGSLVCIGAYDEAFASPGYTACPN